MGDAVKNCRVRTCPYHEHCGALPFVCVLAQYVAIVAVLGWVGYLFLTTA